MKELFLDMDGVIVAFDRGIIDFLGLDTTEEAFQMWNDIYNYTDLTPSEFWHELDASFWEAMEPTPEADTILSMVDEFKPVLLSMLPLTNRAEACHGKVNWIRKHMPDYYNEGRFLIGGTKHQLAGPGKMLIDDSQANCEDWSEHGGHAILVPRPWNKDRGKSVYNAIYYGLNRFSELKGD